MNKIFDNRDSSDENLSDKYLSDKYLLDKNLSDKTIKKIIKKLIHSKIENEINDYKKNNIKEFLINYISKIEDTNLEFIEWKFKLIS